jgi:hypothetical protein
MNLLKWMGKACIYRFSFGLKWWEMELMLKSHPM